MKNTRAELINWFNELGLERKELPYELVRVFADEEMLELTKSINQSFDNVERVLTFRTFLNYGPEEPEDLWHDLEATLDDISYYACLAIPLIRQLLEPSVNFIYANVERGYMIDWEKLDQPPVPMSITQLPKGKQQIASEAWILAGRMEEMNRRYLLLGSSKDLYEWCKYFLEICAKLLLVTARLSLLEK